MTATISDTCTVLAFYGTSSKAEDGRSFYESATRWFSELGWPPDKLSVKGSGYAGKPISFSRADAKLKENRFLGVHNLFVVSMTPDGVIPVNDYMCAADWASDQSWAFVSVRTSLVKLSHESLLPVARKLIKHLCPEYGIGYVRRHDQGPAMYAIGINQGGDITDGEDYDAELAISRWSDAIAEERVWRQGIIRDVYLWNFLTRPQLDRSVGQISLERWIEKDSRRGVLKPLEKDVILWEVEESNIAEVRQKLWDHDVIYNWRGES